MDSGALEDGDDDSDEFDFERPLLPEEVMWVVDELICREVLHMPSIAYAL